MGKGLADELRAQVEPLWNTIYNHPFIKELEAGKLPMEKLQFYVKQDYIFLTEFARCFTIAASRRSDPKEMERFIRLAYEVVNSELPLQRRFAKSIKLNPRDLESARPHPTCSAYADHLFRVASLGSPAEFAASICPCTWTYLDLATRIGQALMKNYGVRPEDVEWWTAYASPEYFQVLDEVKEAISSAATTEVARVKEYFLRSSEFEKKFWDMAYGGE